MTQNEKPCANYEPSLQLCETKNIIQSFTEKTWFTLRKNCYKLFISRTRQTEK